MSWDHYHSKGIVISNDQGEMKASRDIPRNVRFEQPGSGNPYITHLPFATVGDLLMAVQNLQFENMNLKAENTKMNDKLKKIEEALADFIILGDHNGSTSKT